MSKHTPRPWRLEEIGSGLLSRAVIFNDSDELVAEVSGPYLQNYDGHIIAAAPDMLTVCESLMSAIDGHTEWSPNPTVDQDNWNEDAHIEITLTIKECRALKSALAKATGQEESK